MQYENHQPAEGINTSHEHPLKEFAQLLMGVAVVIVAAVLLLTFIAGTLVRYIPFQFEQTMFSSLEVPGLDLSDEDTSAQQQYLQALADKIADKMELPEGMPITVHYSDSDTVNAFATLGGNLYFFKGLLDILESEDELAAVMGHEIAHVKLRHPIVALGKGITLMALAASVSGFSGSSAGEWLIGSTANLSLLKFSRDQESAADAEAGQALNSVFGHIGGAKELFDHFAALEKKTVEFGADSPSSDIVSPEQTDQERRSVVIELFRSHPYSEHRWLQLADIARDKGWLIKGELTELVFPAE